MCAFGYLPQLGTLGRDPLGWEAGMWGPGLCPVWDLGNPANTWAELERRAWKKCQPHLFYGRKRHLWSFSLTCYNIGHGRVCWHGAELCLSLERQIMYLKLFPCYFLIDDCPYSLKSALFLNSVFELHLLFLEPACFHLSTAMLLDIFSLLQYLYALGSSWLFNFLQ